MTDVNDQPAHTSDTGSPDAAALQADIERTREELAETVDLLTAKLDVKTRVGDQVKHTVVTTKETAAHQLSAARDKATGPDGRPTPTVLTAAGGVVAAVAAVVLVRLWLGSRRHRRTGLRGVTGDHWGR